MKSTPHAVGSINLRGKKTHTLSCGCCGMTNFKDREAAKEAKKEIRLACMEDDE
jgi:hypothetical protein